MGEQSIHRRSILLGLSAAGLSACTRDFASLQPADHVMIQKADRRLFLLHGSESLAVFDVDLGFAPQGHKFAEGDGRTPEGLYFIDRKNPRSSFHLSLGISYPNARDIEVARALGVEPGGDIFIHGQPNGSYDSQDPDWTAGCIAVNNRGIREIYARVQIGTPVTIRA